MTVTLISLQTSHKNKVSLEGVGGSAPSHSVLGRDVGMENLGWDPQAVGPGSEQPKATGDTVPPKFAVKHPGGSDSGLMSPAAPVLSHRAQVTCLSSLT